jgi:hypothetical protein
MKGKRYMPPAPERAHVECRGAVHHCSAPYVSVGNFESHYEEWFREYLNQPHMTWGIYRPAGEALTVCAFAESVSKRGVWHHVWSGLKQFAFFPDTKISACQSFSSDDDALMNDWVMVGADLYGAVRQYRINAARVHPDAASTEPTTTAAAR